MIGSFLRIIIALSTLLCAVVIICLMYGILFHHLVGFADYTIFEIVESSLQLPRHKHGLFHPMYCKNFSLFSLWIFFMHNWKTIRDLKED